MREFKIEGMTCGHCQRAVIQAVHAIDPQAEVSVDLASATLRTSSQAPDEALAQAIAAEGYRATPA